jgi:hypothetical protein
MAPCPDSLRLLLFYILTLTVLPGGHFFHHEGKKGMKKRKFLTGGEGFTGFS